MYRFDIRSQLRDPFYRDFRRCPGSLADLGGAGAYPTWTAHDTTYRIPGQRLRLASHPIPADSGTDVNVDTDLIFLAAFRAVSHRVLVGGHRTALAPVARLDGDANVVNAAKLGLVAGGTYYWRVDAIFADGSVRNGTLWEFTVGPHRACPTQPPPPAPPSIPKACSAALKACCSDVKGAGSKCLNHVRRHNHSLTPPPADCTLEDEDLYCGVGAGSAS